MTYAEKKIEEFKEKFSKPYYPYELFDWVCKALSEVERKVLKSVEKKCDEIDKRIFNAQDPAWKDRGLRCDSAKEASNALDEVVEFCENKLKELPACSADGEQEK